MPLASCLLALKFSWIISNDGTYSIYSLSPFFICVFLSVSLRGKSWPCFLVLFEHFNVFFDFPRGQDSFWFQPLSSMSISTHVLHLKWVVLLWYKNVIEMYASNLDICICHIYNTECFPNTHWHQEKGVSVEQGCIIKYPPLLLSTATNCSLASSPHFEPTSTSLPFSWVLEEALDKVDLKIWHV